MLQGRLPKDQLPEPGAVPRYDRKGLGFLWPVSEIRAVGMHDKGKVPVPFAALEQSESKAERRPIQRRRGGTGAGGVVGGEHGGGLSVQGPLTSGRPHSARRAHAHHGRGRPLPARLVRTLRGARRAMAGRRAVAAQHPLVLGCFVPLCLLPSARMQGHLSILGAAACRKVSQNCRIIDCLAEYRSTGAPTPAGPVKVAQAQVRVQEQLHLSLGTIQVPESPGGLQSRPLPRWTVHTQAPADSQTCHSACCLALVKVLQLSGLLHLVGALQCTDHGDAVRTTPGGGPFAYRCLGSPCCPFHGYCLALKIGQRLHGGGPWWGGPGLPLPRAGRRPGRPK